MKPSDVAEDVGIAGAVLAGYSIISTSWIAAAIVSAITGVAWALAAQLRKQGN